MSKVKPRLRALGVFIQTSGASLKVSYVFSTSTSIHHTLHGRCIREQRGQGKELYSLIPWKSSSTGIEYIFLTQKIPPLLALGLAESRIPGNVYLIGQILICRSHASQYTEEGNIKYMQKQCFRPHFRRMTPLRLGSLLFTGSVVPNSWNYEQEQDSFP